MPISPSCEPGCWTRRCSAPTTWCESILRRAPSTRAFPSRARRRIRNGARWTPTKSTPYQDGTDGGHPVVALLSYHDLAPHADRAGILKAVRKSLEHELAITSDVNNPFGYARQLVEDDNGKRRAGYFLPHDIHGRSHDMWWQGENARLGSLATAARCAAAYFDSEPHLAHKLRTYANDQLNWILGLNPYAACMLAGSGLNTPQYDWQGSWQFLPYAGGVCNGITGRHDDGSGIAWNRGYAVTGKDDDWRWQEQWLPHASWFLYAACIGEHGKAIKPLAKKGVRHRTCPARGRPSGRSGRHRSSRLQLAADLARNVPGIVRLEWCGQQLAGEVLITDRPLEASDRQGAHGGGATVGCGGERSTVHHGVVDGHAGGPSIQDETAGDHLQDR